MVVRKWEMQIRWNSRCWNARMLVIKNISGSYANLSVQQHGTHDLGVGHSLTKVIEGLLMILVGSMREVKPSHIHSRLQQLLQHGHLPGFRAKGADDLGLRQRMWLRRQQLLNVDLSHPGLRLMVILLVVQIKLMRPLLLVPVLSAMAVLSRSLGAKLE